MKAKQETKNPLKSVVVRRLAKGHLTQKQRQAQIKAI